MMLNVDYSDLERRVLIHHGPTVDAALYNATRSMYYDIEGKAITSERFRELLGHPTYRMVAFTEDGREWSVSTIWLGLDHSLGRGPVKIFETLVTWKGENEAQQRYSTQKQAMKGHLKWVERCEQGRIFDERD